MKKFTAILTCAAVMITTVITGNESMMSTVSATELVNEDTYMGCTMDSPLMTGEFEEGTEEAEAAKNNTLVIDENGNIIAESYLGAELKEAYPRSKKYTEKRGVDISHWQNDTVENGKTVSKALDFEAMKKAGYTFAIIKLAGRTTGGGTLYKDPCFDMNYKGAVEAGLRVGVYFYAQALNEEEAIEEAQYTAKLLNGKPLSMPVFYDYEWTEGHRLAAYPPAEEGGNPIPIPREDRTNTILAFCKTMKGYGYSTGVYASAFPLYRYIDGLEISKDYYIWAANYGANDGNVPEKFQRSAAQYYYGPVDIWQFTSRAEGVGCQSSVLDANLWYDDGTMTGSYAQPISVEADPDELIVYRLYDHNSGEHFYTTLELERDNLVGKGWYYEGIAWKGLKESEKPVARVYNPNSGEHFYTMNPWEMLNLTGLGWIYEGNSWSSNTNEKTMVPVYRLYNPNAPQRASHHYTTNGAEKENLVKQGWIYEGEGWYGK